MGTLSLPWIPATSNEAKHQAYVTFSRAPFVILDADRFAQFLTQLFITPAAIMRVTCVADVLVQSPIGIVTLGGIGFDEEINTIGTTECSAYIPFSDSDTQGLTISITAIR